MARPLPPGACRLTQVAKQLTRRDKRRWKQRLVRDFEQAWDARDFRSMHQSARSLSGRHLGPKRRRYDKPLSCAPSKHQWSEYMQQHGPQGGCSAQVVTWKEHCQQHWSHARSWRERWQSDFMFRQRMVHLANQDLENLRWSTKQNRPRKVAPPWTLPNEIWRMLFWPNSYRYEQKQGLGFVRLNLSVPHSAHVSKRSCRSRGVPIQLLLTGIFRQVPASANPMARLVVRVFVSSMCLIPSEKLSTSLYGNAQVPKVHVTMLQDMLYTNPGRKPSCSSSASHPVSMLPNVVMPRSSRMSRMLSIPPTTTSWTRLLISQPGWRTKCCSSKGTLQHASKSMGTTARSCWLQAAGRCKAMLSRRSCSWKNTIGLLMTGWQSCALSHGTVFLTQLTPIRVNGLTLLCRHMQMIWPANFQLHRPMRCNPAHTIWTLCWIKALRRDTWLKIGISRRWWYTLLAVTHKNKCGKYITRWFPWKARLSQSQAIWERCFHTTVLQPQLVSTGCMLRKALGPAWDPSGVPKRTLLSLFRGMVVETIFAGLTPFILNAADYSAIDAFIAACGRKLMCGKGCKKIETPTGEIKYEALPNKDVFKFLGIASSIVVLRVRRLQWWQRLLRFPRHHSLLFAIITRCCLQRCSEAFRLNQTNSFCRTAPWARMQTHGYDNCWMMSTRCGGMAILRIFLMKSMVSSCVSSMQMSLTTFYMLMFRCFDNRRLLFVFLRQAVKARQVQTHKKNPKYWISMCALCGGHSL